MSSHVSYAWLTVTVADSALPTHGLQVRRFSGGFGRHCALVRVAHGSLTSVSYTDVRVALAGGVDAGKSSLVAVLTHGADGRCVADENRNCFTFVLLFLFKLWCIPQ